MPIYRFCMVFYLQINILLRFIFNLLWFTMFYRDDSSQVLNYYVLRYIYFVQISSFLTFIKFILLKSGDIETNVGSNNLDQNPFIVTLEFKGNCYLKFVAIPFLVVNNTI